MEFFCFRNGSAKLPVKQLKGKPTARLLRASRMGLKMTDMFHDGPAKLTVSDAWTLIHLEVAKRNIKFNRTIAGFQPGWLVDKVLVFLLTLSVLSIQLSFMKCSPFSFFQRLWKKFCGA